MHRWLAAVLSVLLVVAAEAAGDLEVSAREGRVTVRARNAPLSEVLEKLAGVSGMKVVYDGTPPRVPVTTTIEGVEAQEAVIRIFDGLGLNYAFMLDPRGTGVATLFVAGPASPSSRAASHGTPARPPLRSAPIEPPDQPSEEPPAPEFEAQPAEEPGVQAGVPAGGTPPAAAPPISAPAFPWQASFPQPLTFPSGASLPRAW
jgi:hypothetical protein